jgi:transposase
MSDTPLSPTTGLTVRDVARRWRVGPDWIRALIRRGELRAISTARSRAGKPRYVVLPEHLQEYERRLEVSVPAKPAPRRQKRTEEIDFYP